MAKWNIKLEDIFEQIRKKVEKKKIQIFNLLSEIGTACKS